MSGITITADSGTQFEGSAIQYTSCDRLDDDNFVVAFADNGDGNKGKVNVGSRSGTTVTISESNVVTFNADTTSRITVRALSSTSFVISYHDVNSSRSYVIVGTISGSTITLGSAYLIYNAATNWTSVAVLSNTYFIGLVSAVSTIYYYLYSVSGTVISLVGSGGNYTYSAMYRMAACGLDSTHFIIALNSGSNLYLMAATVNLGTGVITMGGLYGSIHNMSTDTDILIDKFSSQHVLVASTTGASGYTDLHLWAVSINLTSLVISYGSPILTSVSATDQTYHSICCLNNLNFVASYYTTTGTQGEVRSGTCSDGATTIAWDAQGAVAFDNTELSHTALCRLTDTYFLLGFNHV